MSQCESCTKTFDQQNPATQHTEDGVGQQNKTKNWNDSEPERNTDRSESQSDSDTDESQIARNIARIESYFAWDMNSNESHTERDTDSIESRHDTDSIESRSDSDTSSSEESYNSDVDIGDNQNSDIDGGETRMEGKENRIAIQDENKNEHESRTNNEQEIENVCLDWVYDVKSEVQ